MESSRSLSLLSVRDGDRQTQAGGGGGGEEQTDRQEVRKRERIERRDGGQMLSVGMQVREEEEESQGHTFISEQVRVGGGQESLINGEREKMRKCQGRGVRRTFQRRRYFL